MMKTPLVTIDGKPVRFREAELIEYARNPLDPFHHYGIKGYDTGGKHWDKKFCDVSSSWRRSGRLLIEIKTEPEVI